MNVRVMLNFCIYKAPYFSVLSSLNSTLLTRATINHGFVLFRNGERSRSTVSFRNGQRIFQQISRLRKEFSYSNECSVNNKHDNDNIESPKYTQTRCHIFEKDWNDILSMVSKCRYNKSENSHNWQSQIIHHVREALPKTNVLEHLQLAEAILFSNDNTLKVYYPMMFDTQKVQNMHIFSAKEIELLMFFVFFYGNAPDMYLSNVEDNVLTNLHKFTINQVGMVCLGFFHSNRRLKFELADLIATKVLENLPDITMNNLVNILKSLRHANYNRIEFYENLSSNICKINFNSLNVNQLMHIMFVYASLRIYQTNLLDYCASYILNHVQNTNTTFCRTKDIAKIVWSFSTFHHVCPDLYETLYSLFHKAYSFTDVEASNHPESIAEICTGFCYMDIYADDILDILFSKHNTLKLLDANLNMTEKRYQLLVLHHSVALEHAEYKGHKILRSLLPRLPDLYGKTDNEVMYRKGLQECYQTLCMIVGEDNVLCHFILPHFNIIGIELRVRKNGRLQAIKRQRLLDGAVEQKIAVVVLGYNQCASNTPHMLGYSRAMLRQLGKLGYNVVSILPDDAQRLMMMTEADRKQYIIENILDKHDIQHIAVDINAQKHTKFT